MRRKIFAVLMISVLILTLSSAPVYAEDGEMWSEEYYRAVDVSGGLSEAQEDSLDSSCLEFIDTYHLDMVLLSMTSDRYEDKEMSEIAEGYYEECGFGYGPEHSGFMFLWYTDTDEAVLEAYGDALSRIPEDYIEYSIESALANKEQYGIYGPMYSMIRMLAVYMDEHPVSETETETEVSRDLKDQERVGEGSSLPSWYPADKDTFIFYHDEEAQRVVDQADIFTTEEESRMESRLSELREELGKDIVIYTEVTSYGMDQSILAADFYDYNGYGIGDEHEGACLFICMDPEDRGWWCCCTGPVSEELYTEEAANQIDDLLYEYMKAGDYGEGVTDWIENMRKLYRNGSPFAPDWAVLSEDDFERFHDTDALRVTDDAGILSEEEEDALREHAAAISQAYNVDVVIHTALHQAYFTTEKFAEKYYYFNGYGYGDDHDGILLTIFKRPGYSSRVEITSSGSVANKLTDVNYNRLKTRASGYADDGEFYDLIDNWLDQTDHMLRTGRVTRTMTSWTFFTALELIAGAIVGAIMLSRAKRKMATPKVMETAGAYIVPDSLRVDKIADNLINTTTSRTYSPLPKDTDRSSKGSSSSSGKSSYSKGYSGSSGRSHTGSGRKF